MTTTAARIIPATPELESAVLLRKLMAARRMALAANDLARVTAAEAVTLQAHADAAQTEYQTHLQEYRA